MKYPESPYPIVSVEVYCHGENFFIRELGQDGEDSEEKLSEWRKSVMSKERLNRYYSSYSAECYDEGLYSFDDWIRDEVSFEDIFDFYEETSLGMWLSLLEKLSESYIVKEGKIRNSEIVIPRKCSPEKEAEYKRLCHEFRIWEAEQELEKAKAVLDKLKGESHQ